MAENYFYPGLIMVLVVGGLRREDKMPFDPCTSGFGSGNTKITRTGKCEEENGLSLGACCIQGTGAISFF